MKLFIFYVLSIHQTKDLRGGDREKERRKMKEINKKRRRGRETLGKILQNLFEKLVIVAHWVELIINKE
jgi:hypothetical protein